MIERRLVGPRRLVEARELSHELERCSPDLLVGRGRVEVKQSLDVSAHSISPRSGFMASLGFRACTTRVSLLRNGNLGAAMHPSPEPLASLGFRVNSARGAWCGRRDLNPAAGSLGATPICL